MSALETLLAVQELDTVVDQLEHRRRTLPERAALREVDAQLAEVDARLAEVQGRRDEIAVRQARLEEEVARTEARITEIDKRLYSGTVSASRELQAMADEIDSLKVRCSGLEDEVFAAMEEAEPVDAELAALRQERERHEVEGGRLLAAIADAEAAIDGELVERRAQRTGTASGVPDDLLAQYERLRASSGGIGAARLVGASCTGCHLTLPATALDRIRRLPPDAVVYCDQCGRILVH